MSIENKSSSPAKQKHAVQQPHLIVISPPHQAQSQIIPKLFLDTKASVSSQASQDLNAPASLLCYDIPSLDAIATDLSWQDHQNFNFSLLSSRADVALIIIDAAFGLEKRDFWTKALTCLAAIPHIVVAIDNMSSSDFSKTRFEALQDEFNDHAVDLDCPHVDLVPIDLGTNDNLHTPSPHMAWHKNGSLAPILSKLLSTKPNESASVNTDHRSDQFAVYLSWISKDPMLPGRKYLLSMGSQETPAHISTLKYRLNPQTLGHQAAKRLFRGNVGYGNLSLDQPVSYEVFEENRLSGSFLLKDPQSDDLVAFGLIKHALRRATNIRWQALHIDKSARALSKQQRPCVLWFTGLSGSGKSTIASLVEKKLHANGRHTYVLDGDNVRHGLCRDLGFTDTDRVENMRRISETAKLFVDAGLIVLVSFISPFRSERKAARKKFAGDEFIEIFVDTPLEVCEARDIKGLYKKARAGQLKNFTGIDSPYEPPENAELILPGASVSTDELVEMVVDLLKEKSLINN